MKKVILFVLVQSLYSILLAQSSEELYKTAQQLFDSKNYSEAIPFYSKLIALNKTNDTIYYNRGICKYNIKDYKGAIADFSQYLLSDTANARAYLYRGESKVYSEDTTGGLRDFHTAIELEPKESYVRVWRGDVYSMLGWMEKGRKEFDTAILINNNDYIAHYYRAYNLKCVGESKQAYYDIKIAYSHDSTDTDFAILYGEIKRDQGSYNEALSIFTRIITLKPDNAAAYLNRANTYLLMKDEKQSDIDLKIAASLGSEKAKKILEEAND
jgi:tetratricopeptide (TPR) repeat protein